MAAHADFQGTRLLATPQEQYVFDLVCQTTGASAPEVSAQIKDLLVRDQDVRALWEQVREQMLGDDAHSSTNRLTGLISHSMKASPEFQRVLGVEDIQNQLSLTPQNLYQAETELEDLNRKTQSLVELLRSHNTRLSAITDNDSSTTTAQSALSAKIAELKQRKRTLEDERGRLAKQAEPRLTRHLAPLDPELHSVESGDAEAFPKDSVPSLSTSFDELLGPHDRILEKLDALCSELQVDGSGQTDIFKDARRLSNEIILSIVAHQRMVLDITFLETCEKARGASRSTSTSTEIMREEIEAITADLRSLWEEVVPVAHMAVEKQLIGPILKSKSAESDSRDTRYGLIATYTSAVLRYMNERLSEFASRVRTFVHHHQALLQTFEEFHVHTRPDETGSSTEPETPRNLGTNPRQSKHTRGSSTSQKPPAAAVSRKNSKTTAPDAPLELLRQSIESLGVSLPFDPEGARDRPLELSRKLEDLIRRRADKSHLLAGDMQALFEATAKAALTDAQSGNRMLADALIADSAGGLLTAAASATTTTTTAGAGAGAGGATIGGFFADAELDKIITDETNSVSGIVSAFRELYQPLHGARSGSSSDDSIAPAAFVAAAYQRAANPRVPGGAPSAAAVAAAAADAAAGGHSRRHSRRLSRPLSGIVGLDDDEARRLRDPKLYELIDKWGGNGATH